jgi:hypothetical protein
MSRSNILEVTNLSVLKEIMGSCVTVILGFTTPETPKDLKVLIRKFLKRKAERFPLITFVYMEVSDRDRKTLNILRGEPEDYPKIYHIRGGNNILVAVEAADDEKINESFDAVEQFYIKEMKDFQNKIKRENSNKHKVSKDEGSDTPISDKMAEDCDISVSDDDKPKTSQHQTDKKSEQMDQDQENVQNGQNNIAIPEDPVIEKKKTLEKLVFLNKKSDEMKLDLIRDIAKRKKLEGIVEKKKAEENKVDDGKEYRKSMRKTAK